MSHGPHGKLGTGKKLVVALAASAILLTACQPTRTPVPTVDIPVPTEGPEAADDLVHHRTTIYRASVYEDGKAVWPPIEVTNVRLQSGAYEMNIWYRANIETAPGTRRYNLLMISGLRWQGMPPLSLYTIDLPTGIGIGWDNVGGLPGSIGAGVAIDVAADMAPGQYAFRIGLEFDGKDFGTIPCVVQVTEGG